MKVSAQYAQEHLAELLETADRGGEVEIAREGKPSYHLFLVEQATEERADKRTPAAGEGDIVLGAGRGELNVPTWEEWQAIKEEDARYWDNHTVMTSGEV